jgi:hypothetical protein
MISITARMFSGEPTEVPPNFKTFIVYPFYLFRIQKCIIL